MIVLADAPAMFARGLTAIYHGQLMAYYECIMNAPATVLSDSIPRMKAQHYPALCGKTARGARKTAERVPAIAIEDEAGAYS